MINQEFKALGRKCGVLPNFWDLLQGARGTQSYEFSRMRAQFLLCRSYENASLCIAMVSLHAFSFTDDWEAGRGGIEVPYRVDEEINCFREIGLVPCHFRSIFI